MDYRQIFNDQVIEAVMTGSMEREIRWVPTEVIGLQKRIKYHSDKYPYIEDSIVREEMKARLNNYRQQLNEFSFENTKCNYFTNLRLSYLRNNLPNVLGYNQYYSRPNTVSTYYVNVKFVINFESRKRILWTVESIMAESVIEKSAKKHSIYSHEYRELDKIPGIFLTLPHLITPDLMIRNLENLVPYAYDFRNQ